MAVVSDNLFCFLMHFVCWFLFLCLLLVIGDRIYLVQFSTLEQTHSDSLFFLSFLFSEHWDTLMFPQSIELWHGLHDHAYMIFGEISYGNSWRKDVVNQCLEFGVGTETKPATMALCWTLLRKREPNFTVMIGSTMLHPYLQSSVNLTDFGHVSV